MFRLLAAQGAVKEQNQHPTAESAVPQIVKKLESSVCLSN